VTTTAVEQAPTPAKPPPFPLWCTRCGRHDNKVKYSHQAGANICQPRCTPTQTD